MKRYPEIVDYDDLLVPERRWLSLAGSLRAWSPDPDVQVGAVCLPGTGKASVGIGWNRFPLGYRMADDDLASCQDHKRACILHAEAVAVQNCPSPQGGTLFMSGAPICSNCAAIAADNGICKIVMQHRHVVRPIGKRWADSHEIAKELLRKVGISLIDVS